MEQKEQILLQRKELERVYKDTMDSILAAQEIQQSIFPTDQYIKSYLPESFILNKPKNLVSGDFYWFDEVEGKVIIAVADCTGHGVSGAFMALLGHNLLNQSIYLHKNLTASHVLNRLNEGITNMIKPMDQEAKILDGMDVGLCIIDKKNNELQFAGARCPLYLIRKKELIEVKASRFAIGFSLNDKPIKFENNIIKLEAEDSFYIFSDGYADQIGGKDGNEKFKYQRFRELLLEISDLDMAQQKQILDDTLSNWRKDTPQLDDVMVVGFKINLGQNEASEFADASFSRN
jgi:serine phosphatase RsbU (regulator of sigma subunit)